MSPRRVIGEVDLFVTRRVLGRQFRLAPGRKTNRIVGYVLAVLSKKYRISIYAVCVLSDHWHVVFHDQYGNSVDFVRDCHSFIARAVNAAYGDVGALWNKDQTNRVRPVTPNDTIDRIAYTMANPVKHGLVKEGRLWPGLRRSWPDRAKKFKRPPDFFRDIEDDGTWPDEIELEMTRPPGFEHLSDAEMAIKVREAIREAEDRFRAERTGFIGRRGCKQTDRYARAKTPEKKKRRKIPTVACADENLKELELARERAWRARYARRLARWCAGERDVEFPHGTYKMRVLHGVNVAPPPPL